MRRFTVLLYTIVFIALFMCGCDNSDVAGPPDKPAPTSESDNDKKVSIQHEDEPAADDPEVPDGPGETDDRDHEETRGILVKALDIGNLSYTAKFTSVDNEFAYEFYKRDNMTKMIINDGDYQNISVSDGISTIYYSLPDKIGYTMFDAGDDMGLVPSAEALLNEGIYQFLEIGEEAVSGYLCQVVETSDEFGTLKIWISKEFGLPIKYIGVDDNGWYSLELTDIRLDEPPEDVFTIPADVVMSY